MRTRILLPLLLGTGLGLNAQIQWLPCTMPLNTLTLFTVGPYGELLTMTPSNPSQPRISTDQGQTWQTRSGIGAPNGALLFDQRLHMTNAATILLWGNTGLIDLAWRSDDGGETFTQLGSANGIPPARYFQGFFSAPSGDVYLYGEGVLRSTDDGQSWTEVVPATTMVDALVVTTTHMFGLHLGEVHRGGLDGAGFGPITTGGPSVLNGHALARGLNERIIAVGGSDRVITSADGGDTWFVVDDGIDAGLSEVRHIAASLSSDTWVAGQQISAFFTDNGGAPWVSGSTGLDLAQNEPIQGIFCDSIGTFYLHGYFHLYRSDLSTGLGVEDDARRERPFPNPTAGPVRLPAEFAGASCMVVDAMGRTVLQTVVGRDGLLDLTVLGNGRYMIGSAGKGGVLPVEVLH